ncbi:MAG: phosphate ABC transporter substrate-binding protein [Cyclobacteriaceae bacterium]
MNKLWIALWMVALVGCNTPTQNNSHTIRIKGSESMISTFEALKWDFEQSQDSIKIQLEGGGSRTGLEGVGEGTIDIGMSSFEFNVDSIYPGQSIKTKRVAFDGIVVILNEKNLLSTLSNADIRDIYTGRITNWNELGGSDGEILPIVRDENSGTQRFFKEYFGLDVISAKALVAENNNQISEKVATDVNAIGYMGYGYFTDLVTPCGLEFVNQAGDTLFLPPNRAHLESGEYPLKRGLFVYHKEETQANTAFMTYLNSPAARKIISNFGLIVESGSQSGANSPAIR